MPSRPRAPVGPGRVLALMYGFFVLAAGARSAVQIATKFSVAPLAYGLSAVAACVYTAGLVVFVVAEVRPSRAEWAFRLCAAELAGVVVVGAVSVVVPRAFPDATVWSGFGSGYAYVPLVLPILGMAWARRQRCREASAPDDRSMHAPRAGVARSASVAADR